MSMQAALPVDELVHRPTGHNVVRGFWSSEPTFRAVVVLGLGYACCLLPVFEWLRGVVDKADLSIRLSVPAAAWVLAVTFSLVVATQSVSMNRPQFLKIAVLGSAALSTLVVVLEAAVRSGWHGDALLRLAIAAISIVAVLVLPPHAAWALTFAAASVLVAQGTFRQVICVYPLVCTDTGATQVPPELVLDGYLGYNIVRQNGRLYAIRQGDGRFEQARFRSGGYTNGVEGESLNDVEVNIATLMVERRTNTASGGAQLVLEGYEGYNILFVQGRYLALPQAYGVFDAAAYRANGFPAAVEGDRAHDVVREVHRVATQEPSTGEYVLRSGFYPSEGEQNAPLPRWTAPKAQVLFSAPEPDVSLAMRLVQPQLGGRPLPSLVLLLDGNPLPERQWQVTQIDPGRYDIALKLPDGASVGTRPHRLVFMAPTFVPAQFEPSSRDERALGVRIEAFSLTAGTQQLRLLEMSLNGR